MTRVRPKRATPRRRTAPQETDPLWWVQATHYLAVRSGGRCEKGCKRDLTTGRYRVERHHRQRRRDGGDRLANLLLLCSTCHQWITEHPTEARNNGWIVPIGKDPASVPVVLADGRAYLLDDLGGKHLPPPVLSDPPETLDT